ncbi:MAG TPA: ATP-binding cassette domain-containing protein [Candidatus Binatia bacterium]|nr:ATP-binding cassette domain-containing protein [Candidatus Binatia bacterium]
MSSAVSVHGLNHSYGTHRALTDVSFEVSAGEIFGLLGPNGGGKTTLFRILATLMPVGSGRVEIAGIDASHDVTSVRRAIGVVFQSPSLDIKLTVRENLVHHGHLYGMRGSGLDAAIDAALARLGLGDRRADLVETLSGGLKRRVELAKGLLSEPSILILDEPSTGLDPGARRDLWEYLSALRARCGTTILVTTHLMEEAERCDRLGILDRGKLISSGTPDALRRRIGGDVLTIRTADPDALRTELRERLGHESTTVDGTVRLERPDAHLLIRQIYECMPERIESISLGHPTLEDVFIHETGHRFWSE